MNKTRYFFTLLSVLIFFSCSGDSAQELLRKEQRAIEAYIKRHKIKVLNTYPADGVFAEDEYFKTSDGLYLQVVDSGYGDRKATLYKDIIVCRFESMFLVKNYVSRGESAVYTPYPEEFPIEFTYGIGNYPNEYTSYGYACNAWIIPLNYVKEGGVVNMLAPSSLLNTYYNQSVEPIFFRKLTYTKFYDGF